MPPEMASGGGASVRDVAELEGAPAALRLAGNDAGFVAAWGTGTAVHLQRLDRRGTPKGRAIDIESRATGLAMAAHPDAMALALQETDTLELVVAEPELMEIDRRRAVAKGTISQARLVARPEGFALTFVQDGQLEARFLSASGERTATTTVAPACGNQQCGPPSLPPGERQGMATSAWGAGELGVLYVAEVEARRRLFLARVEPSGRVVESRLPLTRGPVVRILEPTLGWDGSAFVATWGSVASRGQVYARIVDSRVVNTVDNPEIEAFSRHPHMVRLER